MQDYEIYPKQFRTKNLPIIRNSCFMLMPFNDEFDLIYGSIKDALNSHGYSCRRCDEISASKPIISDILTGIMSSQFVIVDISGANPNVFYELGIAHVFKDARNVFLIKDRTSKTPFDITHLRYHDYDRSNLKLLTSRIISFCEENTVIVRLHEALNVSGIIDYVKCDMDQFVMRIQTSMGDDDLSSIADFLFGNQSDLHEEEVEALLIRYESLMTAQLRMGLDDTAKGLLRIYCELLFAMSCYGFTPQHLTHYLGSYFGQFDFNEGECLSQQIDCAVSLVSRGRYLSEAMPWVVDYFRRSKTANIDLNRYKLESLLTTTNDPEINTHIANAIMDDNCYIREHFSDIAGAKRLDLAYPNLVAQLNRENNYYSANSMIAALGRIGNKKAVVPIFDFIERNIDSIVNTRSQFLLNHARASLAMLDSDTGEVVARFERQFGDRIGDRSYL